ncbi:MAG TPA: dihydroorotate dehydrogenase [Candidatus Coproplasma excrementipullorum]|nr:dihydroorotate dehydrogenase [Candidatus Coproplasma excrementipullorum]
MANLKVNICGVEFKNPVIAASGTYGFGREFEEIYDISCIGGVSTKGTTLEPRLGNPVPRIAEGSSVILNAVGLQNPGVEHFIKDDLPFLKDKGVVIIANVAGNTLEDYQLICRRLNGLVDMVELNISCPNVHAGGMALGIKPQNIREVTSLTKAELTKTPLIVKLSPNVESIPVNARAAEEGGADCISLVNTFTGMVIDLERRKPIIANNTGGVSGAGIKPIALRMVYEAAHAVSIPVIGMGGIATGCDALEFMCAGAKAVQVGTANFTDSLAMPRIIKEMNDWLDSHNISDINDIVDTLKLN